MSNLLKIGKAAEELGVDPQALLRWSNQERIKTIRHPISNIRYFEPKEIAKFKLKLANWQKGVS